ncbi:MAG: hypothetical protein ACRC2R_09855 [Xenococcaceae cyanobacterium]
MEEIPGFVMKLASVLLVLPLSLVINNPATALITAVYHEDIGVEFTICKDNTYQDCKTVHTGFPEFHEEYSEEDNAFYLKDWESQCDRYMNTGKVLCMKLSDKEFYDPFR